MKRTRFLAYSCKHVPLQDETAIDWLCNRIAEHKPDVIIDLGDGIEANASSRWDDAKECNWTLKDEYAEHCRVLKAIRKAAPPKTRRVYLPGNHDDNITRIGRIDRRLRDLTDWRLHRNQPELYYWHVPAQYVYCRTRGCFRIGQVVFAHGYETGVNGDEFQTLYLANEFGLGVFGHTHRPSPGIMQAKRTGTLPLRYWYANVGCMRQLDPDYMSRNRKLMWGQACVVGEADEIKSPRAGRQWSAHIETHRMYDQFAEDKT